MEPFTLPSIPLDAQSLSLFVHVKPSDGWYSVPSYISGTSDWMPVYIVQLGADKVMIDCEVKPKGTMYECVCDVYSKDIGEITCPPMPGKIPLGNGLKDCKIEIYPGMVQSIRSIKSSGGLLTTGHISRYCQTKLSPKTNLVIPRGTIIQEPYHKAPGYYYTPTWMDDAPEWALRIYTVGDNLWAACAAHLKDSQLSCDCTILARDIGKIMYCPSRNSVPLAGPLDIHKSQHCELYLHMDETKLLSFKTKEDRLNKDLASNDMDWPCWATKLVAPTPAIKKPSTASKDLEFAEILLEFADKSRTDLSADGSKLAPVKIDDEIPTMKHQPRTQSQIMKEAAAAGLDTTLPFRTLDTQLKDLTWERDMLAVADKLDDPVKRESYIKKQTRLHQRRLINRKSRAKMSKAKADQLQQSAASDEDETTNSGSHDMHIVEGLTVTPLIRPSRSRDSSLDSLGKDLSKDLDPK